MNKMKILIYFGLLICVLNCSHRQIIYEERKFNCLLTKEFEIEIIKGNIELVEILEKNNLYTIEFDKVKGGDQKILGLTWSESDGNKSKRLIVTKANKTIAEISINDLFNLQLENSNDTLNLNSMLE